MLHLVASAPRAWAQQRKSLRHSAHDAGEAAAGRTTVAAVAAPTPAATGASLSSSAATAGGAGPGHCVAVPAVQMVPACAAAAPGCPMGAVAAVAAVAPVAAVASYLAGGAAAARARRVAVQLPLWVIQMPGALAAWASAHGPAHPRTQSPQHCCRIASTQAPIQLPLQPKRSHQWWRWRKQNWYGLLEQRMMESTRVQPALELHLLLWQELHLGER